MQQIIRFLRAVYHQIVDVPKTITPVEYKRVVAIHDVNNYRCDVMVEVENLNAESHDIVYHVVDERLIA